MDSVDPNIALLDARINSAPPAVPMEGDPNLALLDARSQGQDVYTPPPDTSIWGNVKNDARNRLLSVVTNPPSVSHILGQGYGLAGDVVGEGINALTPDTYINAAHSAADSINNTSAGQKLGDMLLAGKNTVDSATSSYPKTAQALGDALNVASFAGGGKAVDSIEGTGAKIGLGDKIYNYGKVRADAANEAHINDLVRPPQTATEASDSAKRSVMVNGNTIYQHTPHELEMSKAVKSISGTGDSLTAQGNLSAIVQANRNEAQALQAHLEKNNIPVNFNDVQNGINNAVQNIKDNPLIVGDGKEVSQAVINGMNKAILNNMSQDGKITAAGMLQARKDFDAALPPRVFNSSTDTAFTTTAKEMRNMMNGVIAKSDPSANVAESLKKQSLLYDAADNIAPKAAKEKANPIARAIQNITPHSLGEMGGTGAAMYGAHLMGASVPGIALPLAGYGIVKGATAPSTSMMLGRALGVSAP